MELTMYDKLLQLPLFQGMSKFDFTDILEKVKIHFNKYEPGSCLVRQDTPCNQLIFVLDGEVQIESKDRAHQYTIWETFKSPNVIEPYYQLPSAALHDSIRSEKTVHPNGRFGTPD